MIFDLKETEDNLIAYIELPGFSKEDIQLLVKENNLEIKVDKKSETRIKKKGYLKAESSFRSFYRSISLPYSIIPEQVKASYNNEVLKVVMPKVEKRKEKKKTRKISVR